MSGRSSPRAASPRSPAAAAEAEDAPTPAPQGVGFVEADDGIEEVDSSLEDDNNSSTASITSSILKYREENGRTYHAYKDGKYMIPNDDREQERLDLQHYLFLITFQDKLQLAPIGKKGELKNVLDIGTGTGLWALDFADEHPETHVIGVDLSPIQPDFVAPNMTFQVDDLEEPWTFTVKFDFIYSRMMTAAIADWPRLFKQAYENLAPGGWLEVADICPITSDDGTMTDEHSVKQWVDKLLEGTRLVSRPFDGAYLYKEQLEAQGFKNVTQVVYKWPQNRWPKDPKLKEIGECFVMGVGSVLTVGRIVDAREHLVWARGLERCRVYSSAGVEQGRARRVLG